MASSRDEGLVRTLSAMSRASTVSEAASVVKKVKTADIELKELTNNQEDSAREIKSATGGTGVPRITDRSLFLTIALGILILFSNYIIYVVIFEGTDLVLINPFTPDDRPILHVS